jgi:hypothetical protein
MSSNAGGMGQEATRRPGTFTDQHGRKWSGMVDKRSGFPVSLIHPKGWQAPWMPPKGPEVFVFDRNDPTRFRINYEWLLQQRANSAAEYDAERNKAAVTRGWTPDDPEKQEALDMIVGRRESLQRPEIIKACMDGNPYALGLTKAVDPRVTPFLEQKKDRIAAIKSKLPDFSVQADSDSLADDLEARMDLEEAVDPKATPKHVPIKTTKKPKAPSGVAA